jgi:hypothetical protein
MQEVTFNWECGYEGKALGKHSLERKIMKNGTWISRMRGWSVDGNRL